MIDWIWKVRKTEESGMMSRLLTWATRWMLETIIEVKRSKGEKKGLAGGKWWEMEMIQFWRWWFWNAYGAFKEQYLLGCWGRFKVQKREIGLKIRYASYQQVDCNWSQRSRWDSPGEICRLHLEGRPRTAIVDELLSAYCEWMKDTFLLATKYGWIILLNKLLFCFLVSY